MSIKPVDSSLERVKHVMMHLHARTSPMLTEIEDRYQASHVTQCINATYSHLLLCTLYRTRSYPISIGRSLEGASPSVIVSTVAKVSHHQSPCLSPLITMSMLVCAHTHTCTSLLAHARQP